MLQGELPLARVAGICLAEHGVAVAGNDLSGLEQAPNVFLDLVVGGTKANVLSNLRIKKQCCDSQFKMTEGLPPHLAQEHKHLLVREAMKWSSQP